jgi:CTP:molybdopterin cytidylyltransferase MocA
MAISGDIGAKPLLARHAAQVTEVEMASDGIFADVDRATDLARIELTFRARNV